MIGMGCSGGEPAGPRGGSPEWHWENASAYYDRSEYKKMVAELDVVAERDTPLNERAVLWRTAILAGLAQGYMELGDAYREAIEEKEDLRSAYQNPMQQADSYARQYSIELAESLGEVEKAMSGEKLVCDFPFPGGAATPPPDLEAIRSAKPTKREQLFTATELTLRRGMILAVTELCGFGDGPEFAPAARSSFESGPTESPLDEARLTVAKILLDTSLVFSRTRLNQGDVRKIFIDRAEQWNKPYLESEDEALKKRSEEFLAEVEDERRDMTGKARRLKKRE